MATDHSQTGPKYAVSYGYSTSSAQSVGRDFAMGAMVIADYGKHRVPELQALLKDRIVIGAYRTKKDVDLNTLRQSATGLSKQIRTTARSDGNRSGRSRFHHGGSAD